MSSLGVKPINSIEVVVDPDKIGPEVIDHITMTSLPEHLWWCMRRCKSFYTTNEDYSCFWFGCYSDALEFRLKYGSFEDEKEKMWWVLLES